MQRRRSAGFHKQGDVNMEHMDDMSGLHVDSVDGHNTLNCLCLVITNELFLTKLFHSLILLLRDCQIKSRPGHKYWWPSVEESSLSMSVTARLVNSNHQCAYLRGGQITAHQFEMMKLALMALPLQPSSFTVVNSHVIKWEEKYCDTYCKNGTAGFHKHRVFLGYIINIRITITIKLISIAIPLLL